MDLDFDYFTVYGSNVDSFASAEIVNYCVAPQLDITAAGFAFFYVTATDFSGNESGPASIEVPTGIRQVPRAYVLSVTNFPNPFNPRTTVSYTVPSRGAVTIAIYDARGVRVATLLDNETRDAGAYRVDWDGRADHGATLASGIYFARIEHAGGIRTRKMVLLK